MVDLVTAATRRLRAFPAFQLLVSQGFIGTDAYDSDTLPTKVSAAWLFQGLDNEGRPFRDPEGSGKAAIVLTERSEWAAPNRHNTAYFPELQMLIYMDSTRDEDGSLVSPDADSKTKHVFRLLDRCFHLVGNTEAEQKWSTLRVHSSVRSSRFVLRDVPGTQSATVRGEATYETLTD